MTKTHRIRRTLAATRLAPIVALPPRLSMVGRYNARIAAASLQWLTGSREHTNLTYDLTAINLDHLAWFVANVARTPVCVAREFTQELLADDALREHIRSRTAGASRRGIADVAARYGRRLGWYSLVRALKPQHVVETGTDKGLGSCVLAAALLRNGSGRLTTIDINPESGYLIAPPYSNIITRVIGDSLKELETLPHSVDMFLHDSDHSPAYEAAEFTAIAPHLSKSSIMLSDNAHATSALATWAEANNWEFLFFDERPARHWYPGDGIGAAYQRFGDVHH